VDEDVSDEAADEEVDIAMFGCAGVRVVMDVLEHGSND